MCLLSYIGLGLAVGPGCFSFGLRCSTTAWCPSANLVLVAGGGFSWVAARLWRRVLLGMELPRRLGWPFGCFGWIALLREGARVSFWVWVAWLVCFCSWFSCSALGVLSFAWCALPSGLVLLRRVLLELLVSAVLGLEVYSWGMGSAACGLNVCSCGGFFVSSLAHLFCPSFD
ncbi:hypothetical protein U1Q18_036283 [Sarracenia purpurea var. burkii]